MGLLIDGQWHDRWYDTASTGGRFVRQPSSFHGVIAEGADAAFVPEAGRYHLYVSLACPWAHRTLIFRKLKRLEPLIGLSVVDPVMGAEGWVFSEAADEVNGCTHLHQIYTMAKRDYTGRVTVPVLWDRRHQTIVNNESAEIIRLFNSAFDKLEGVDASLDLYPTELRHAIDAINGEVYQRVNNGVYRAGFATTQQAYEEAVTSLFDQLDALEQCLGRQRYLVGERLTEADWRLFTTLVRFDSVYVGHFKCNLRRLVDFPDLWGFTRELYQMAGVAETVSLDHIKRHYYASHSSINPTGIIPKGPQIDFMQPHERGLKSPPG